MTEEGEADPLGDAPSPSTASSESAADEEGCSVASNTEKDDSLPPVQEQLELIGFGQFHKWSLFAFCALFCTRGADMMLEQIFRTRLLREWTVFGEYLHVFSIALFVSTIVGLLAGGILGDRQGRHPVLLASSIVQLISTLLSVISPEITFFLVMRCLGAFCTAMEVPVILSLAMELVPMAWRSRSCIVLPGTGLFAGSMMIELGMASLQVLGFESSRNWWRCMLLICAIPQILGVYFLWSNIPESPRWLVTKGRVKMCSAILNFIAEQNSVEALRADGEVKSNDNVDFDGNLVGTLRSTSFLSAWSSCGGCLLITTACVFATMATDPVMLDNEIAWFLASCMQPPAVAASLILTEFMGHRAAISSALGLGAFFATCLSFLPMSNTLRLCFTLLLLCTLNAANTFTLVRAAELLTTSYRCTGVGMSLCCGALGTPLAGLLVSLSMVLGGASSVAVLYGGTACLQGVGIAVMLLMNGKETRFEDIMDWPDAPVQGADDEPYRVLR